ncbi:MAG: xanthine dehydrogenase family protein molybdopterin-binding subunit [Pelolinea sp.]|nr:xanthine dehydrogenase family protein molybdopterin-binding subunit [Pelolinea sp.]
MKPRLIGQSIPRRDNYDKVTGAAKYPGDFYSEDQLCMKILFSEKPHAIVKKVDTQKAEDLDGVITILTSRDVPCNEYGLMKSDQPVLCGPGSGKDFGDHVRCVGDQIAVVIAENELIAEKALSLIEVEFEELPIVSKINQALKKETILLHPNTDSNINCQFRIENGDIKTGTQNADFIIEGTYHTPAQEHAYLQPEAGFGYMDKKGRITIVVAGQWAHEDREQIAHSLKIPEDKIRVIYPAIGGAFGGREDMSIQIVLALAVKKINELNIHRPIKIVWSRKESIIGHHKRHPYEIYIRLGSSKEGKFTFLEADIIADSGAYMCTTNKVLANATLMTVGPYHIPNVSVRSRAVYTNNLPFGAFRGFGGPQGCFAIEMQINKMAEAIGIDPVELRLRNTIKEGQLTAVRSPLPKGITIDKVIRSCTNKTDWIKTNSNDKQLKSVQKLHGTGFAAGFKNVGFSYGAPENCWAEVELHGSNEFEKLILRHAGADVGQGAHSVFIQIAADTVGIPIEKVVLIATDTAETGNAGSSSASRMTFMAGNAIIGAAKEALEKWKIGERPAKSAYVFRPPATTPLDDETGACTPNFSYGYVAESVEVEVDTETGKVKLRNVICADDVGKAINPQQIRGQIEGAVVQAAGYTLLEKFVQENGIVKSDSLATYLIPTIMDIPDKTDSIILEEGDPIGPSGARGMAEMPYIPFAPAVLSAVHDATGIWFNSFPLTEEVVLKGLGKI